MNALVKQKQAGSLLRPQTFADLLQFANLAAKTKMVPTQYQGQPESIVLAVQMGDELGLAPMQSLQNIAVVNGRPSVWGDAVIGLCRQSPVCKDIVETMAGEGDKQVATCTATRVGSEPVVRSFSVEDAKKAGLWGKSGPWQQYPKRMLQMRARGFAVRDAFPDVLRGLITAEEAADIPARDNFTGTTLEGLEIRPDPKQVMQPLAAPPPAAPRTSPTRLEVLMALEAEFALCQSPGDADLFDEIVARPATQKAMDTFQNGHRDRLNHAMSEARRRTSDDPPEMEGEAEDVEEATEHV